MKASMFSLFQSLIIQISWSFPTKQCGSEAIIEQVTQPVMHAEGPHWDVETQKLFYVDIEGELVNRYDPATGRVTHAKLLGGGVSIVIPVNGTNAKKLLATRGHDVLVLEWNYENVTFANTASSENITVISSVETVNKTQEGNRWNDGKADAKGRLWAGTIGPEPVPGDVHLHQAAFYLLNPNTTHAKEVVSPVSISNGLVWNKDNTLLYYIDTATDQVDVFDFDLENGLISNRRKVFNLTENNIPGLPDGMTMDNNGNLWVACFFGGRIININPRTGELIRFVKIPAERVTSLMFGGPNLDILYVTTSRYGLSEEQLKKQPLAGSVFAVTCLGVKALAPAHNVIVTNDFSIRSIA